MMGWTSAARAVHGFLLMGLGSQIVCVSLPLLLQPSFLFSSRSPFPFHCANADAMDSTATPPENTAAPSEEERPRSPKTRASKWHRPLPLPLADVTNLLPNTPTPTTRRPLPSDTSASSSSAAPATPVSRARPATADEWSSLVESSSISTVYARRKAATRRDPTGTGNKGGAASCPPLGKAARTGSNHSAKKVSQAHSTRPSSSSVPCHHGKKRQRNKKENLSSEKPKLPEDFVKKQRAYFEEVDAFELPEEEASETDLD